MPAAHIGAELSNLAFYPLIFLYVSTSSSEYTLYLTNKCYTRRVGHTLVPLSLALSFTHVEAAHVKAPRYLVAALQAALTLSSTNVSTLDQI